MNTPKDQPDPWRQMKIGGFIDHIGPMLAKRNDKDTGGGWRYGLRSEAHHANPLGILHGGVITSLIDHAIALVAWEAAGRQPTVTVQVDTRFLNAARVGDLVEVQAKLRHQTRSLIFLDAEVTVEGKAIATASSIMKMTGRKIGQDNVG
jgi:uncharacterized protein (TIGR00369 family)